MWERSVLGHSVNGSPVRAATVGEGPPGLILGGTHGDEPASTYCVQRLMEHPELERVLGGVRLTVVDAVNPDGLEAGIRHNARGVDINRNFPTENWVPDEHNPDYAPGPEPASEPETRILVALLEELDPRFILTLHAPLAVVNYDGPAEDLATAIAEINGYPVSGDIGYPTPGSFGTYAGMERAIPTVTLELGSGDGPEEWAISGEAMMAGLRWAASRARAGD
jgi:protein MpaA